MPGTYPRYLMRAYPCTQSLHIEVLDPLHVLLVIALELPEDYFIARHKCDVKSEDHLCYIKYSKYIPEEYAKIGGLIATGHTDLGSWTSLPPTRC